MDKEVEYTRVFKVYVTPQQIEMIKNFLQLFDIEYEIKEDS